MHQQPVPHSSLRSAIGVRVISARRINDQMVISTLAIMFALLIAAVSALYAETSDETFQYPAPIIAAGLAFAFWTEAQGTFRNLVRVDILMLFGLYLLTFFEFLFPQTSIADRVSPDAAQTAVRATLIGFGGIALGRHAFPARQGLPKRLDVRASPRLIMTLLLGSAFMGYLYMLIAVRFDVFEMIYQMTRPRFSQPWTRGQLGSLSTLLNEFGLLKYLIPPLVAAVLVQRRRYKMWQVVVAIALLALVFFESFSGGTRNVFLTHLITFVAAYVLLQPRLTLSQLAVVLVPLSAVAFLAVYYLPELRTVGLQNFDVATARTDTLFVDMNLVNIAQLTVVFPDRVSYLLLEIPYNAVIRSIPRAFWPGKPEGLSVGIEEALGADGLTLSATFVGEFWMAGGYVAVALAALAFGAIGAWWNRRAANARTSVEVILFVIGFFPAALGMRSFLSVTPAILPVLAVLAYLRFSKRRY